MGEGLELVYMVVHPVTSPIPSTDLLDATQFVGYINKSKPPYDRRPQCILYNSHSTRNQYDR